MQKLYKRSMFLWNMIILADFLIECCKTSDMSIELSRFISISQIATTFILLFEIIFRFAAAFPDWRSFFLSPPNIIDIFLAIITTVILLPQIRSSDIAYGWLSIFQIARIYRVISAFKYTRENWVRC